MDTASLQTNIESSKKIRYICIFLKYLKGLWFNEIKVQQYCIQPSTRLNSQQVEHSHVFL